MGFSGNILAIDTAMGICAAGLWRARDDTRFSKSMPMPSGHAEHLIPFINDLLSQSGLTYGDIGAVVTTTGPGTFTGLRIGLSAARGLALALNIPLHGITTTQALALQYAHNHKPVKNIAAVIETKREDFYFQIFSNKGKSSSKLEAVDATLIRDILNSGDYVAIGDGLVRLNNVNMTGKAEIADLPAIDAGHMAWMLAHNSTENIFTKNVQPVYLRDADVSAPKTPPRVMAAGA
jgi:tRNA threonylcarbamoyladenosine biosynthesis protein TsaB